MFNAKQLAREDALCGKTLGSTEPMFANGDSCICFRRKYILMFSAFPPFQLALTLDVTVDRKHQVEFVPHLAFYRWFFILTVR